MNQIPLCRCSFGPYARAMVRVCKEESFHQRQGFDIMIKLCQGTPEQKAMAQDALNRWWWPSLMMFGPPDADSRAQRAIGGVEDQDPVQRRIAAALRRPDRAAGRLPRHFDARPDCSSGTTNAGTTISGPIDLEEFYDVVKGNGPCNRDRLRTRVKAWEDGAWVREAAMAHAQEAGGARAAARPARSARA